MTPELKCSRCDAVLPVVSLGGHCARCLAEFALTPPGAETSGIVVPLLPRQFGDYELLEEIARGGMGAVFRARQRSLNREVALKMILAGEFASTAAQQRFRQEAKAAARLQHPNIVAIHEIGECEGQSYFTMDLVEGETLADFVRRGAMPARRAAECLQSIAEAMQYAHDRGVLHRDLKPSNILLDLFGQPRITDFGLARSLAADPQLATSNHPLTVTGQALGSPGYISPEQAFGKHSTVGPASDVFSLGAMLYHVLTGHPPFQGGSVHDVLMQVQNADAVPPRRFNPRIPVELETICLKCLEKDATRRYRSARELAEELGRFLRDEPIHARPIGALEKTWRFCRRRPAIAALSASVFLLLLVVAIGSTFSAWRINEARYAEQMERQKSDAANRQLRTTVSLLELQRAEGFFEANDAALGVAHLAAILRRDPSNHIAADRLVSALVHRNWALPSGSPLRHGHSVETVRFSPGGRHILSVSKDSRRMAGHFTALSESDTVPVPDASDNVAHVWNAETGALIATLPHDGLIHSGRYNEDGGRIVTASADGSARIWNATNGMALSPPLRHNGKVFWAELSRDGRSVVTASADRTARIWDAASGEPRHELRGHNSEVRLAHFSPDGRGVVTATRSGTIRLWDAHSGKLVFEFWDHRKPVNDLAFSRDSRKIIAACADGRAWLLNLGHEPVAAKTLRHGALPLWHAAFSPDNRFVLTTSEDATARLWNATDGFPIGQPLRHQGGVVFGDFSADSRLIVTTSSDGSARVWLRGTGELLCQPLRHDRPVRFADFTADSRRLVTAASDGIAQVWSLEPRHSVAIDLQHARSVTTVRFNGQGDALLSTGSDKTAVLWDARTWKPLGEPLKHSSTVLSGTFSADGRLAVTTAADGTAQVWDLAARKIVAGPVLHTAAVLSAKFSPGGERFVTASVDDTARVWDARTGRAVTPPLAHRGDVLRAAFSTDGNLVVTASEDFTARVWDANTGAPVIPPLQHGDHVKCATFSPDGKKVLTASTDNTACIWDVQTGRHSTPPLRHARIVEMAAFSPDGRLVVTVSQDRTARVWDANTGRALTPPLRHDSAATHVSFSPDGTRILTGGWNQRVRVWDTQTGRPLTEWLNTRGFVSDLCFDPTGQHIATGARGGFIRVWKMPAAPMPVPASFIALAEAMAGTRLSELGNVELMSRLDLEEAARPFLVEDSRDFYERLGQWILADPTKRAPRAF